MEKILVTGAAGFIGYHLCKSLLDRGFHVVGLDNCNDYYTPKLKYSRLEELGILNAEHVKFDQAQPSTKFPEFEFFKSDITNQQILHEIFEKYRFKKVIHLAAQAGVRYSIENPSAYYQSNIIGFGNILEVSARFGVEKLIYASSFSIYGNQKKVPFAESDAVDKPISVYAATKKSNELMAHVYSSLYGMETIGLRFFTVYGPWGRPDMAPYLFTNAILHNKPIQVFNNGDLKRDFTYIDDIVSGIITVSLSSYKAGNYEILNIGNNQPEQLLDFISYLESAIGKKAIKDFLPMQPGDVYQTFADLSEIEMKYGYKPVTRLKEGIPKFVDWFVSYHNPAK